MTPAPPLTDKSVQFLTRLFGDHWWLTLMGHADVKSLIANLAIAVNSIALASIGLLLSYIVINAAIATSHDGVAMGKKYHSFWVPFRGALSIGLTAPVPTLKGLTILQGIVLLFTFYGIGFADNLYGIGLNYLQRHSGSLLNQVNQGQAAQDNQSGMISSLFKLARDEVY